MKILKRFGMWHWWCRSCMGGDWTNDWSATLNAARQHQYSQHPHAVG